VTNVVPKMKSPVRVQLNYGFEVSFHILILDL